MAVTFSHGLCTVSALRLKLRRGTLVIIHNLPQQTHTYMWKNGRILYPNSVPNSAPHRSAEKACTRPVHAHLSLPISTTVWPWEQGVSSSRNFTTRKRRHNSPQLYVEAQKYIQVSDRYDISTPGCKVFFRKKIKYRNYSLQLIRSSIDRSL